MAANLIPSARASLTDLRTNLPVREWYLYWLDNSLMVTALDTRVTTLEGKVAALEVAVAALDARVYTLEHLRVARAGMRKTVAQNLGTLTTTWVNIDGYSNQIYASAIGAGYSLTTGAISVNVPDDYIYLANIEFACTVDNNSSRQIEVRLFNLTDNQPVAGSNAFLYIGSYSAGISTSFSIPTNMSALINKAICMQIHGVQNFAGAQLLGAVFSVTSIDPIVSVP